MQIWLQNLVHVMALTDISVGHVCSIMLSFPIDTVTHPLSSFHVPVASYYLPTMRISAKYSGMILHAITDDTISTVRNTRTAKLIHNPTHYLASVIIIVIPSYMGMKISGE